MLDSHFWGHLGDHAIRHAIRGSVLFLCAHTVGVDAVQLPRYDLATRIENHMLPAVSTGPMDPAWSPDGQWIAFSMRGDIWKVPSIGGQAIALTQGPAYHFEPAWSPDGNWVAYSFDLDGNLDIGLVSSTGSTPTRLTTHDRVDIQPSWSADGTAIFFATARNGNLDIFRIDIDDKSLTPIVVGRGNQFSPHVSPDGNRLAYVSPVAGRLGSGGIWIKDLVDGDVQLAHYEETSYRATPRWTSDGVSLVYASDAAGDYDLAIVPANGGNRVRLTHNQLDEFGPAVSPDGRSIAFVSNRVGPTELFTLPIGGGARNAWRRVPISTTTPRRESGTVRVTVSDNTGQVTPARVYTLASDNRAYTPDGAFHRVSPANELHYFHTRGNFDLEVPAGSLMIEITRGFEFTPTQQVVNVQANRLTIVQVSLPRLVDATQMGWYSGDTHVHDLHEGRYGLTQEEFFYQFVADDLHVANDLIHMDGTKLMGRWTDLTGRDFALSNDEYILRYSQEFRGSYGHVGLLGVKQFIMPLIGGTRGSPYAADVLKTRYLDGVSADGGIGGYLHPYNGDVSSVSVAAQSDIPVHAALGKGDFFDVVSIASDELASAAIYYRMLNSGLRLAATGGTDNFSNVWRDPSAGTARTYAHLDGPLSWTAWIDAVRQARTFATNGPLIFATVGGKPPGAEIIRTTNDTAPIGVVARVISMVPVDRLEVIVNGQVAATFSPNDETTSFEYSTNVELPNGGWVAVRTIGSKHRYTGDNYVFAHTSPVYVTQGDHTFTVAADAQFLLDVVDTIWQRVDAGNHWNTPAARTSYLTEIAQAREVYLRATENGRTIQRD